MKHKAHIADDWMHDGVQIALVADSGNRTRTLYDFGAITLREYEPDAAIEPGHEARLSLPIDAARALYEALADHFGHAGHDARALRRDYEAERKRVDLMIGNLIGGKR